MHLVISISDLSDFLPHSLEILRVRLAHSDSSLAGQKNLRATAVERQQEVPDVLTELVMVHIGSERGASLTV